MKIWKGIAIAGWVAFAAMAVGAYFYAETSRNQIDNQLALTAELKAIHATQLESVRRQQIKQIQDILKNVAYLGKVERLRESVLSRPIESLIEEDIGKMIEDELIQLPIAAPFQGGYRTSAHYGDDVLEGHWRKHKGIDLVPMSSGIVYPTAPGTIAEIGEDAIYGKYIVVQHEGYRTKYAHLKTIYWQNVEEQKVVGETVDVNSRIGYYGNTGKTQPIVGDGSHLHYEVQWHDPVKDVYVPIDPEQFLSAGEELAKETENDKDENTV